MGTCQTERQVGTAVIKPILCQRRKLQTEMKPGIILFIILLCGVFVPSIFAQDESPPGTLDIVVHPDVRQQNISRNVLRAIFGMRLRKWPDGMPIKVFVLKDDAPFHAAFSKEILHVFPHQLRRAWDRLVYSGTGQSPFEVSSMEEMKEKISNITGAIGYLPSTIRDQHAVTSG